MPPAIGPIRARGRLVAGKLQTLFSMNATMAHPIKNISFQGLKFRECRQPSLLLLLLMSQTCG